MLNNRSVSGKKIMGTITGHLINFGSLFGILPRN